MIVVEILRYDGGVDDPRVVRVALVGPFGSNDEATRWIVDHQTNGPHNALDTLGYVRRAVEDPIAALARDLYVPGGDVPARRRS